MSIYMPTQHNTVQCITMQNSTVKYSDVSLGSGDKGCYGGQPCSGGGAEAGGQGNLSHLGLGLFEVGCAGEAHQGPGGDPQRWGHQLPPATPPLWNRAQGPFTGGQCSAVQSSLM